MPCHALFGNRQKRDGNFEARAYSAASGTASPPSFTAAPAGGEAGDVEDEAASAEARKSLTAAALAAGTSSIGT